MLYFFTASKQLWGTEPLAYSQRKKATRAIHIRLNTIFKLYIFIYMLKHSTTTWIHITRRTCLQYTYRFYIIHYNDNYYCYCNPSYRSSRCVPVNQLGERLVPVVSKCPITRFIDVLDKTRVSLKNTIHNTMINVEYCILVEYSTIDHDARIHIYTIVKCVLFYF